MTALSSAISIGANLEEAARSVLAQTDLIKRTNDIYPDEIAAMSSNEDRLEKYGAKKNLEHIAYGLRCDACRILTDQTVYTLEPSNATLVYLICRFACAKLGVGYCGELGHFSKYLLAKANVLSVVVEAVNTERKLLNHTFVLIGSVENWKRYYEENKAKDLKTFFEQLPGAYIVDPLLRSHGPTQSFRTSPTASYLNKMSINKIAYADSEVWNPRMLEEIETKGEQLLALTRSKINDNLDDWASYHVRNILQLQFKSNKWKRMKRDSCAVCTHGKEEDLRILKGKLAELGVLAEVEKRSGDGFSHSLVITKLPITAFV